MGSSRRERGVNEKMLFYEEKVAKMTSKMVIFPKEIEDHSKMSLGVKKRDFVNPP